MEILYVVGIENFGATPKKYTLATSFVFMWIFHVDNKPRTIIRFMREEQLFIYTKTTVIS